MNLHRSQMCQVANRAPTHRVRARAFASEWLRLLATAAIVASIVALTVGSAQATPTDLLVAQADPGAAAEEAVVPAAASIDPTQHTVVLLHGLGRSKRAMATMAERLQEAGFRVERIGYRSFLMPVDDMHRSVARQIDACCAKRFAPVHFVGHSLGGLMVRRYLAGRHLPNLGRVVLIGTPNQGTHLVDQFESQWWLRLMGPATMALGSGPDGLAASLPAPHYPVGIIAGQQSHEVHDWIPGADDGLVSVESTRLDGMQDFVLLNTSHWGLRYEPSVIRQVVAFLRLGQFDHNDPDVAPVAAPKQVSGLFDSPPTMAVSALASRPN